MRVYIDFIKGYIPIYRAYYLDPRPLVMSKQNVAISWSAKSGSAQILLWYLAVEGLLDEAIEYHAWPHHYRDQILYLKPEFRNALSCLRKDKGRGWILIKVMRSPLSRLVSSYRHALRFGYADKKMSKIFGRNVSSLEGFSIATFLDFLNQIDINKCNMHFRTQMNPVDSLEFQKILVINIDKNDLFVELKSIENFLGLERANFEETNYACEIEERHHSKEPVNEKSSVNLLTKVFDRDEAKREWPSKRLRQLPEVELAAKKIYSHDYEFLNKWTI